MPGSFSPLPRIASVDLVRGLVMIFMVVDHVRYPYFTNIPFWPEDLENTSLALFLTRWITHFCAPLFFFLAGTSTFLSRHFRNASARETAGHLWKRGLWLVLLEVTLIDFLWGFMPGWAFAGVIWSLGWCMVLMAGVILLPMRVVVMSGFVIVVGHHVLEGLTTGTCCIVDTLWDILYRGRPIFADWLPAGQFPILYTLLPHLGVMMLGYALGPKLVQPSPERSRFLLWGGGVATALFILLRATNLYGNPSYGGWGDFVVLDSFEKTFISFLNVNKYPFSFQFLLMTIGPGLILMGWMERMKEGNGNRNGSGNGDRIIEAISVFGRVPFFFYIVHIPLIHLLAIAVGSVLSWPTDWLFNAALPLQRQAPPEFGFGLAGTWLITVIVVLLLYFPCRWFARVKRNSNQWWIRYL